MCPSYYEVPERITYDYSSQNNMNNTYTTAYYWKLNSLYMFLSNLKPWWLTDLKKKKKEEEEGEETKSQNKQTKNIEKSNDAPIYPYKLLCVDWDEK